MFFSLISHLLYVSLQQNYALHGALTIQYDGRRGIALNVQKQDKV